MNIYFFTTQYKLPDVLTGTTNSLLIMKAKIALFLTKVIYDQTVHYEIAITGQKAPAILIVPPNQDDLMRIVKKTIVTLLNNNPLEFLPLRMESSRFGQTLKVKFNDEYALRGYAYYESETKKGENAKFESFHPLGFLVPFSLEEKERIYKALL